MKTKLINNRAGVAVAALAASIGLSTSAQAILFQNLPPTGPGAQYVFKLANYDAGTLYNTALFNGLGEAGSPNVSAGNNAALLAGVNDLNTKIAPGGQAFGAHGIGQFGANNAARLEDSWGIAIVTQIFLSTNAVTPVWDSTIDGQQLSVMFYGEQDYYAKSTSPGNQTTDGVGLKLDVYLTNAPYGALGFNQDAAGGRPADDGINNAFNPALDATFPTVNDGTRVLSLLSTSGFINAPGVLGGVASEFQTTFNGNALNGSGLGSSYFDVNPVDGGTLGANYNTNSFVSPYIDAAGNLLSAPGAGPAKRTDMSIQFTTTTAGLGLNPNNWLVSSNDPLRAVVVPEPTTVLAGLGCLAPVLSSLLGRRRRSA